MHSFLDIEKIYFSLEEITKILDGRDKDRIKTSTDSEKTNCSGWFSLTFWQRKFSEIYKYHKLLHIKQTNKKNKTQEIKQG